MNGYLIYDKKDIIKNQSFIDWFLETSKDNKMTLTLYDHLTDFTKLPLPTYVINRSRKVEISRYFEKMNIPVFNNSLLTELGNDKYKTYQYFKDHIKMMITTLGSEALYYPCVVKEKSGHGGEEVYLIQEASDMKSEYQSSDYIIQPLCGQAGKDLRVYIINNKVIASVLRSNVNDFRSNYSLGGEIDLYELNLVEIKLVENVLSKISIDYGGIDFIFDENNNLILNEIEDVVGARMLYNLKEINIVSLYLQHIKKQILK